MKKLSSSVNLSSVYYQIEMDFKSPHIGDPKAALSVYKLLLRDHCLTADGNTIEDLLNNFEKCCRGCVDESYFWILRPYLRSALDARREYLDAIAELRDL